MLSKMQGISLLVLLSLVQSSQCSLRQDSMLADFKECSNEQLEAFLKEHKQTAGYGPHLMIKEKLISLSNLGTFISSHIEKEQFVEYQRKL